MVNFLCILPCSRIDLTVAMETMDFFIVQLSLSLRTKILCISGVPMNDLAPMKNCPGGGGCTVGQISSRGISFLSSIHLYVGLSPHPRLTENTHLSALLPPSFWPCNRKKKDGQGFVLMQLLAALFSAYLTCLQILI